LTYKRKSLLLITISTVVKLIFASLVELSNAEAYYWAFSTHLQWNYFDHPPIVAWLIRATTANLSLHNELFVRLGAIIASAISTWLMFTIGSFINNERTGWVAALLYTSSIYATFVAGAFIMPDGPQMVFWLLSVLILVKNFQLPSYQRPANLLWCLFGLTAGLCILSKVHGVFLWFGVTLYVLLVDRNWLKYRGVYLSAIITLIVVSPIIIWNLQHDFITYKFHSSRVTITARSTHFGRFFKQLAGDITVCNPVNFFLICSSLVWVYKRKIAVNKKHVQILLFCSLPLIVVLIFISLFRETLPHWPGPAYSTLLILPALKISTVENKKIRIVPNVIKAALAFILIMFVVEILIINHYPGTISEQKEGLTMGTDDATLDMYGWKEAGAKFDSLYRSDVAKNTMPADAPIIVTKWFPAAHIDFYIAARTKQQTIGIGDILDLHQYYWMNEYKKSLKKGDSAYFIIPSNLFDYKVLDKVIHNFDKFEMPLTITEYRSGIICKEFFVFRFKGFRG
jgi:hypothetical protein